MSKYIFKLEIIALFESNGEAFEPEENENLFIAVQNPSSKKETEIKYEPHSQEIISSTPTNQSISLVLNNLNEPILLILYHVSTYGETVKDCVGFCELSLNGWEDRYLTLEFFEYTELVASLRCIVSLQHMGVQDESEVVGPDESSDMQEDHMVTDTTAHTSSAWERAHIPSDPRNEPDQESHSITREQIKEFQFNQFLDWCNEVDDYGNGYINSAWEATGGVIDAAESDEEGSTKADAEDSSVTSDDTVRSTQSTSYFTLMYYHYNRLMNIKASQAYFGTNSFNTDHIGGQEATYLKFSPYTLRVEILKEQFEWRASIDTHGPGVCRPGILLPPLLSYKEFLRQPVTGRKRKQKSRRGSGVAGTATNPSTGANTTIATPIFSTAGELEAEEGMMSIESNT